MHASHFTQRTTRCPQHFGSRVFGLIVIKLCQRTCHITNLAASAPPNEEELAEGRERSRSRSPPVWLAGRIDDLEVRLEVLEDRRVAARLSRAELLRDLWSAQVSLAGLEARVAALERTLLRVAASLVAP